MNIRERIRVKVLDPIRRAQGSPGSIARGTALGMWIALTPTVGAQMVMVALLGVPLRANLPIACAMCWVSNPITVIPLYYAFYWFGAQILGRDPASFVEMKDRLTDQFLGLVDGGVVNALLALGWDILWPMTIGSLIIATAAAIPSYYVALGWARRRRAAQLREQVAARAVKGVVEPQVDVPLNPPSSTSSSP